jgi:hypothetical protein
MKVLFASLLLMAPLALAEPAPVPVPAPKPSRMPEIPWVGLSVGPLEDAMRAHAPGLPPGVGFLVKVVHEGGPAEEAGVKAFDILWKLDDQLLVNHAQFAALLGMHRAGDKIALSVIRSGEQQSIELTLAEMPATPPDVAISPMELTLTPAGVPGMPKTVVIPGQRTAELTREDGSTAKLTKGEDGFEVSILDPEGEVIYEGPVGGENTAVPEAWRCSIGALIRGLQRAENQDWRPRQPRRRVIAPPAATGR